MQHHPHDGTCCSGRGAETRRAAVRLPLLLSSNRIGMLKLTCGSVKPGVTLQHPNRVLSVASDALGLGALRCRRQGSRSASLLVRAGC